MKQLQSKNLIHTRKCHGCRQDFSCNELGYDFKKERVSLFPNVIILHYTTCVPFAGSQASKLCKLASPNVKNLNKYFSSFPARSFPHSMKTELETILTEYLTPLYYLVHIRNFIGPNLSSYRNLRRT